MNRKSLFLILLLVVSGFSQLQAQTGQERLERLRLELEQTDELIRRAEEAVSSSSSSTGKIALEKASQLQKLAWDGFYKRTDFGYKEAAMYTRKARELAQWAISASHTGDSIERLRIELERTDELIRRAEEAVRSSNSPSGKLALEQAKRIQGQAWSAFRDGNYDLAILLTPKARELAQRAIGASRSTEENEDIVLRKLERTTEQMQRLRENLPPDMPQHLMSLFDATRLNLERAWEFFRAHRYRPAVKLCTQVEKAIHKLLNTIRQDDRRANDFGRRAEKVRELLDRLSERIGDCNNENSASLFDNARKAFQHARELAMQGRMEGARAALHKANQLATKAVESCRGVDGITERLERIKNNADRMRDAISSGDQTAQHLLIQVYRQLELTREHIDSGQHEAAAASLKAAELTLRQLKRYLENGGL